MVGLEYGWVYLDEHARVLHGGLLLHLAHDLHLAVVGHCVGCVGVWALKMFVKVVAIGWWN